MNAKAFQPQISQMNTDVLNGFICENLRRRSAVTLAEVDLRLSNSPARETDKALKEILEKLGV
jgi:hypothetical protein